MSSGWSHIEGCIVNTPQRWRTNRSFFRPVEDEDQESGTAEDPQVCFFPNLEALRLWSRPQGLNNMQRQQGVLWKRRDVFKNRWRPRWFVLQPGQGVLTYYLLTAPVSDNVATPMRRNGSTSNLPVPATEPVSTRNRTSSWDSNISENTVDWDVVPRGTIYLLGCSVAVNEALSKPSESLYAFTVRPPGATDTEIHLAARTPEARERWVHNIGRVCRAGTNNERLLSTPPQVPIANGSLELEEVTEDDDELVEETAWKCLGSESTVFENVPPALVDRIRASFQTYSAMCDEPTGLRWKKLFVRGDHTAYSKQDPQGRSIVKSMALLDHPPKQVFNLIVDISRRQEFETNVRSCERAMVFNAFTFADYYVYNAVWPTSAREFAVVGHWQVVGKGNEKAILIMNFSCPESNALRNPSSGRVRANLIISMYLLRPVGDEQCHLTRLLSFDPMGNVSGTLANVIISQQASLPGVIAEFLQRREPIPENRLRGELSNEALINDVIDHLPGPDDDPYSVKRRLTFDGMESIVAGKRQASVPAVDTQAVLLLAPVVIYKLASLFGLPGGLLLFCVSGFLAIRQVVLLYLGETLLKNPEPQVTGPITCRFSIDLKGVLRFVANKKEEREELHRGSAEITLVHLAVSAVARALKNEEGMRQRRITIPWLLIDEYVDASMDPVDVSVSENAGGMVTIKNVDSRSIQEIADEMEKAENIHEQTTELGECLVFTTPDYEQSETEIAVASMLEGVRVVAVIGGVRLERNVKAIRPTAFGSPGGAPRPVLSFCLTMSAPQQTDIVTCRRFADEVQKLLHFPEICET